MKRLVVSVIVLAIAGIARAGPMLPGHVAADAKWFGHVNVEKIRSMQLFQDCRDKWCKEGRGHDRLKQVSEKLGMNPMEDLLAITLYSTQYEGEVGVGLFYVKKLDREKMLAFFKEKHPDHKTSKHADRTLYSWTAKRHHKEMTLTGTFAGDKLIVVGADAAHVKAALDVIDGKKAGLEKDAALLKGAARSALFVSRAIEVPDDYRKATKCPVLRKCTAAFVRWTEKKGQITGKYELTTDSEETARNFKAVCDGFKAIVSLRCGEMKAVTKLMDGLKYKAKGESFSLVWKTTADDVQAAVKQVMERKRKRSHGKK